MAVPYYLVSPIISYFALISGKNGEAAVIGPYQSTDELKGRIYSEVAFEVRRLLVFDLRERLRLKPQAVH